MYQMVNYFKINSENKKVQTKTGTSQYGAVSKWFTNISEF